MRTFHLLAAASVLAAPLPLLAQTAQAPAAAASPNLAPSGNLMTTLKASAHFTILAKALDATNMSSVVASTPGLTLFAPTDEAFKSLPAGELNALLDPKNAPVLQQVLTYHLVHLDLDLAKFKGAKGPVESVEKGKLQLDGSGAVARVNDANIIQGDVRASNGIIQVVDKVLVPADVKLPTATASAGPSEPAGR